MKTIQTTNKQFAQKHNMTDLDARAVLSFLTAMGGIKVIGGVAKQPGEKGRKERIFEIPASVSLDMTGVRNLDLVAIPETPVEPKAPKAKAEPKPKAVKTPKAKTIKAPKPKKAKTVTAETPAETPAAAAPETVTETASAPVTETVAETVQETVNA